MFRNGQAKEVDSGDKGKKHRQHKELSTPPSAADRPWGRAWESAPSPPARPFHEFAGSGFSSMEEVEFGGQNIEQYTGGNKLQVAS